MKKITVLFFIFLSTEAFTQKGLPAKLPTEAVVHTTFPQHVDFRQTMIAQLKVPQEYTVKAVATGLGKPRMVVVTNKGLYVSRRDQGDILFLTDTNGDGIMDKLTTVWANFKGVHGLTEKDGWLYGCSDKELKKARITSEGMLSDTVTILNDLPEGSQHDNRVISFGPDGKLYISVGSSCNDCKETNPEHATILQMNADGTGRRIYARGLRNTIGFDWHPVTRELWGADNGTDWRGDSIPPEELNMIIDGGNYGWPQVYGKQQADPTREDPLGTTKEAYAKTTIPSVMEFPAHSAPIDFKFLKASGKVPAAYQNAALVCWHGSWNRQQPEGFKVQCIKFKDGAPAEVTDFLSGFLSNDGKTRFGRPAGLAISPTGIIYVTDDANGVIYAVIPK
ncbi:PQQ-dependent sugar dehydrogenase [Foetidibacter luteolus]|uniref:PQQ-dependent sugar dehydrogenase n=1 Tax=Foetidibacter luteolus TaxID=2608880 RepID=UPI00129A638B|nr:PQQ-dependent sugar dehydrogenase [Foetidibacter luteolus]